MPQIIPELQDMTHLTWSKIRNSSGAAGSFLKAYEDAPEGKIYYKLSNYDPFHGVIGHECVNEIIVDRLLTLLGIAHLSCRLIHAEIIVDDVRLDTLVCASEDFKRPGESKIALDAYYQAEREPGETPLQFCIRCGWQSAIYEMLVVDYLILNRDRHGANMEVLRNRYNKSIRLAPLFDHGISLLSRCSSVEEMLQEDLLADKPVQCFVGSKSSLENLKLIPPDRRPVLHPLPDRAADLLSEGLEDALDKRMLDRICEMILARWQAYEDFCDQR